VAKLNKRVALAERKALVGGVCINTGTIPSKTLREAALHPSAIACVACAACPTQSISTSRLLTDHSCTSVVTKRRVSSRPGYREY